MKYRRLGADYDMQGHRNETMHYEGADAVVAAIRSRIRSFQGEWWEYPDEGLPLKALVGRLDVEKQQIAEALIRLRVLETEGVINITAFDVKVVGKVKTVFISVNTEFGEGYLEVSA